MAVTMMSASSSLPSFRRIPFLGEGVDLAGDDGRAFLPDRPEQVAVRHQAEPLLPGIVARREMRADVVVRTQRHLDAAEDQFLRALRLASAQLKEIHPEQHVAPADQVVGELCRQVAAQFVGERILRRPRHHVGRRTLQHGDVGGLLGHLRHQRHRGRPRADHHHALSRIVELVRPFLRMHDLSGEIRGP